MKPGRIYLGEVKGDRAMRLICQSLFNALHIEAFGAPMRYDDTVATYQITAEKPLNVSRHNEAITFVLGMICGLSAGGIL